MEENGADEAAARMDRRNERKLRVVRSVIVWSTGTVGVVIAFLAVADLLIAPDDGSLWMSLTASALAVPAGIMLFIMFRERIRAEGGRHSPPGLYWGSLALVLGMFLLMQFPLHSLMVVGSWWATAVFVAPRKRTVMVSIALTVAYTPYVLIVADSAQHAGRHFFTGFVALVWCVLLTIGFLVAVWLWDVTQDALTAQHARARLAVSEERLRFARDMHDLLGHSLSALAVKSELAERLTERDPGRAAAEMAEVQQLAREALQQVRSAVSGYREADLAGEVASVRAVLAANRIRVTVSGLDDVDPGPQAASLAAWVIREGGTNVLRHTEATRCQFAFTVTREASSGPEVLVVEVFNDCAGGSGKGSGAEPGPSGHGLAGLAERVSLGGGALTAAPTGDGGYLLRAVIPHQPQVRTGPVPLA